MSDVAIRVEGLGKRYRIGAHQARYRTLRDTLTSAAGATLRGVRSVFRGRDGDRADDHIWALRDVSFQVKRGEVVGVIGRNGAGKSTLLKILSHITEPTEGGVDLHGRVGSLLEVGTGFHPELTGRENIYLNGAILGMKRAEIEEKFDEIVAFAEIDKFLDTPVKHYSSGMYVRLAFAVAAHLEPEILLIDEVLAVGDADFQKKCLGKMGDVARGGRTVLFVSHNMGAISRLCTRSILLSGGRTVFDGDSARAVGAYLAAASSGHSRRARFADRPGLHIVIDEVAITSQEGSDSAPLGVVTPLFAEIHYRVRQPSSGTAITFALKRDGTELFRSWDTDSNPQALQRRDSGAYVATLAMPVGLFAPGTYSISVGAGWVGVGGIVNYEDCVVFHIERAHEDAAHKAYSRGGLLVMSLPWATRREGERDTEPSARHASHG